MYGSGGFEGCCGLNVEFFLAVRSCTKEKQHSVFRQINNYDYEVFTIRC